MAGSLVADPRLVLGVNSPVELAEAEALLGERLKTEWMLAGATIIDPGSTIVDAGVTLAPGVVVRPFTTLAGDTSVGEGSEIGPSSTIIDAQVGPGCVLPHCYVRSAVLEPGTQPAALHIPGWVLGGVGMTYPSLRHRWYREMVQSTYEEDREWERESRALCG